MPDRLEPTRNRVASLLSSGVWTEERERESRVVSLLSINSHAHAHAQEKQMRHRLAVSKERRGALPDLLGRGFLARGK